MKAIINHLNFEFKSVIRDKTLLLMSYLFPLIFYFMMAAIMPSVYADFSKGMVPGMIVFTIMISTLMGMPNPMVLNKEMGVYRSYKIYGVPLKSVFIIPVVTTMLHITIVSLIIMGTASVFFKAALPQNFLSFFGVYAVVLFAFTGLGALIAVCSPNGRLTVLLAQLVFLPSMLLGGVMMPSSVLSATVQKAALLLPTTYSTNALNAVYSGQQAVYSLTGSLMILALGGIISYGLAAYLFTWDNKTSSSMRNLAGLIVLIPYILGIILL
jgi:ABC-2 type transport system permease protein